MKTLPLTPPYDRYLVEMLDKREQKTAGGIVVPVDLSHLDGMDPKTKGDQSKRKHEVREFRIIARGPGLWERGARQPMQYQVGQVVLALRPEEIDGFDWEGLRYYCIAEASVVVGVDTITREDKGPCPRDACTALRAE